jgi:hypothetical protein
VNRDVKCYTKGKEHKKYEFGTAAAMNFKRAMNLWRTEAKRSWQLILNLVIYVHGMLLFQKLQKVTS